MWTKYYGRLMNTSRHSWPMNLIARLTIELSTGIKNIPKVTQINISKQKAKKKQTHTNKHNHTCDYEYLWRDRPWVSSPKKNSNGHWMKRPIFTRARTQIHFSSKSIPFHCLGCWAQVRAAPTNRQAWNEEDKRGGNNRWRSKDRWILHNWTQLE